MCSGLARHRDAVIIIGQKKHSTYDASHDAFGYLARALHSLSTHYSRFNESDLLLWHEGDFDQRDLEGLPLPPGQNARLCLLSCCSGWGPPPSVGALPYYLANVKPLQHWAPGYLHMIRFMSVTMWSHLAQLGYEYVMRLDDDSVLHSALTVDHGNIFEGMRSSGHVYGYRALAPFMPIECDALRQLGTRLPLSLLQRQPSRPPSLLRRATTTTAWSDFCGTVASVGYYNNWFVAGVRWWLTRGVLDLRRALDNSGLIYTHRLGDLVFHTAAVVTLLPPAARRHFLSFSYEHVTVKDGRPVVGGFLGGYADPGGRTAAREWRRQWQKRVGHGNWSRLALPKLCSGRELVADDELAPSRDNSIVAAGGTPVCDENVSHGLLRRADLSS